MRDVLIISRQRLSGAHNGSSAYLLQIARSLRAAGFTPHLLQPSPSLMGRRPVLWLAPEMQVFESHRVRGVLRLGRLLVSTDPLAYAAAARGVLARIARRAGLKGRWTEDRPLPYAVAIGWTGADRKFVRNKGRDRCDFVVADYMFQAEAFECLPAPRSRCAILMHDLFHARTSGREGGRGDSVQSVTRKEEIAMLGKAGAVIAIQADEADFVKRNVATRRAILAPMAAETRTAQALSGKDGRVLFVGSRTAPNTQGLRWFLDEVWPHVRTRHAEARLDIVGTVSDDFQDVREAGIHVHGRVARLDTFYEEAAIVVSPLRFGSGLKIKLVEAMSWGKAIVASDVTLQGVARDCEGALVRANQPDEFAGALTDLLYAAEPRRRLGEAALLAARRHFGPARAHAALLDWLDSERPISRREAEAFALVHPA